MTSSRHIRPFLLLVMFTILAPSGWLYAQHPPIFRMPSHLTETDYLPGHIIFKLKEEARIHTKSDGIQIAAFEEALQSLHALHTRKLFPSHTPPLKSTHISGQPFADLSLIFETRIPEGQSLEQAINALYATGLVEYAQPRYLPQPFFVPNDPFTGSQYYLNNIRAFDAWALEQGDTSMVIAIVDTGIDLFHPDLIHDIAYNWNDPINGEDSDNDGYIDNHFGWDLGENNNNPQYNANAHGVHVAGIAGASTHNGTGMAGVGFNSRLLPVKVSDADGRLVRAYEGIVYAADQGAQVINCSWGGAIPPGQFGQDIINYAVLNKDAIVIASAGNSNNQVRIFPASYANAMSVAATDINDIKWANSSFGNLVDLSAPGANILSTWINGTYISSSGTSMAAPVVAGAAALLRNHFPHYSALQIAAQLKVTTDLIDTIADNLAYAGLLGTGRLNVFRALTETHHPYIQLVQLQHPKEHYQLYEPGQSFALAANFMNLLASTDNIRAVLSTTSSHVEILSNEAILADLQHMQPSNNFDQPFVIQIKEGIPASHEVLFTIIFFTQDDQFAGRQNFSITFNLDYLNLSTAQLQTTVNSRGNVGYNYPDFNQGVGFIYGTTNQSRTLIKSAGFIAGSSNSRVVDNIYGAMENSFSGLLHSSRNARLQEPPQMGDIHIRGSFTDSLAGSNKIGIRVNYDIYAFEQAPLDKFIILEYEIINTGSQAITSLHAGFFADWNLMDNRNHRAAFDQEHRVGYAFSANGGNFTGIQLLSHNNLNHYAFDNQGFGGSIRINDGFTSFEKYTALRTTRDNAGIFDKDNDISTLISTGPFNLGAGDSVRVSFALLAADHINDLRHVALLARQVFTGEYTSVDPQHTNRLLLWPNPAEQHLHLALPQDQPVAIRIYNHAGQLVFHKSITGSESILDIGFLPSGAYVLQMISDTQVYTGKFLRK